MKTSSGPASVRQHLNSFAIAAALVVGLLGLAWPAEAEIVYTPTNIRIGSSYNLDLNNDGVTDFTFTVTSLQICDPPGRNCVLWVYSFVETPASGNGVEGAPPARLTRGDRIVPNQIFYGGTGTMACLRCGGDWWGEHGFLGLSLQIDGETHYGWANVAVNSVTGVVTLRGYAYETIASMPINAGQS